MTMQALRLKLLLEEPLLATSVATGEENSSISLDYLPGSYLRGACAAAYLRRNPAIEDMTTDEVGRQLFWGKHVFFLNGYPAYPSDETKRALPRPYSWHMDKDYSGNERRPVQDFVWPIEPFKKSKIEARPFFWQMDERPMIAPRRRITVHNGSLYPMKKGVIQIEKGEEENSTVFRYDALAEGQTFIAYVLSAQKPLLEQVEACLPSGRIYLGGSQTAGYGLARLTTEWVEWNGEAEADYDVEDYTVITLLSDAILRASDGQPTTDFHAALQTAIGSADLPRPRKQFAQTCLVGGFNRKWGLPLPQRWAVGMGSTFVYDANDLPPTALEELITAGIGERCNEGFGRLAINLNSQPQFATFRPESLGSTAVALQADSVTLARRMAERRLMQIVETETLNYLHNVRISKSRPTNSQLSRLRLVVRKAQQTDDLELIRNHLKDLEERKDARKQFERRLDVPGGMISWGSWLRLRAENADGLQLLGINNVEDSNFKPAGVAPTLDNRLKIKVTCQLIEAVIRKALKMEA